MRAAGLLRLYPRAWRERYGEEFLQTVGDAPLRGQQVIDIFMGAIDARVSSAVRRSSGALAADKGGHVLSVLKAECGRARYRMTVRDGWLSAGVLILTTLVFTGLGIYAGRTGHPVWSDALKSVSFPMSVVASMPFGILKGTPRRAQVALLGIVTTILVGATYLATLI